MQSRKIYITFSLRNLSFNHLNHNLKKKGDLNLEMICNLVGFGVLCGFFNQEEGKFPKGINYTLSFLKILSQALENQMKSSKKECDLVSEKQNTFTANDIKRHVYVHVLQKIKKLS